MTKAALASIAIIVACQLPGWAETPTYTAVDLMTAGDPPPGVTFPTIQINNTHPVGAQGMVGFGSSTAIYWPVSGPSISLQPTNLVGFSSSVAVSIGGTQQVGNGSGPATGLQQGSATDYNKHALLWTGSGNTTVDLHPTQFPALVQSGALGTNGTYQVGYGQEANAINNAHALFWSGTAASAVDLLPPGGAYFNSFAYGTDGIQQVGSTNGTFFQGPHAVVWNGTAASMVDLHGTYTTSLALGVANGQQVGWGNFGGPVTNAMLWKGTAASGVILNPTGVNVAVAMATNGSQQTGSITVTVNGSSVTHAELWAGTAASAVDLHALLPAGFVSSTGFEITPAGDVFGMAVDTAFKDHLIAWLAPPHAASSSVSAGNNVTTSVTGRSATAGDVKITFPTASPGTMGNTNALMAAADLAAQTAPPTFFLPTANGLVQTWELSFSGTFTGPATVVFHYDASQFGPGFDESDLRIEHFVNGAWVQLTGVVDPVANTITVMTDSFSPFALAAVPEPSSLCMLGFAGALLVKRPGRRRR